MNVRFRKPSAAGMTESAFPVVFDTSTTRFITGTFYFAFSACFASVRLLSYMIPRSRRCRRITHLRVGRSWAGARHDLQRRPRIADFDIDLIVTFQSQVRGRERMDGGFNRGCGDIGLVLRGHPPSKIIKHFHLGMVG